MCFYYNFIFRLRNHSIKNSISELFYNNVKIKKKISSYAIQGLYSNDVTGIFSPLVRF